MLYVFQQKLTLTQAFITVISIKTLLKSDQWCNYVLVVSYFFACEETNRFISVMKEGKKKHAELMEHKNNQVFFSVLWDWKAISYKACYLTSFIWPKFA